MAFGAQERFNATYGIATGQIEAADGQTKDSNEDTNPVRYVQRCESETGVCRACDGVSQAATVSSSGSGFRPATTTVAPSALSSSAVARSNLTAGVATVFVVGSTAGITTLEFEPGVVHDLDGALQKIAPRDADYRHHLRWGDDNGSSHVRAARLPGGGDWSFEVRR